MKFLLRLAIVTALLYGGFKLYERYSGDIAPQLTREFSSSLVFVEGKAGKGSGFICALGGAKFIVTNQHVIAGNPDVKFMLLDQTPVRTGQAAAAVGHDIMRFALLSDAKAMEIT
jgi:S1-C subfamily serine protease